MSGTKLSGSAVPSARQYSHIQWITTRSGRCSPRSSETACGNVIFGAAALNLHGVARFTEDLDIFIASERENIDRLKRALRSVFDDPHIDEISADDL